MVKKIQIRHVSCFLKAKYVRQTAVLKYGCLKLLAHFHSSKMLPVIKMAVNRRGGLYVNGSKLPPMYRERVLDLHHENFSQRQIA